MNEAQDVALKEQRETSSGKVNQQRAFVDSANKRAPPQPPTAAELFTVQSIKEEAPRKWEQPREEAPPVQEE